MLGLLNRRNRCKEKEKSDRKFLVSESRTYNYCLKFGSMEIGEEVKHTARFYDADGRLFIVVRYVLGDDSVKVLLYDYDESALLRRIVQCSSAENKDVVISKLKERDMMALSIEKEIVYEYNTDNRIKSITGKLRLLNQIYDNGYKACYEYNEKGWKSKVYDESGDFILALVFDRDGILRQKMKSDSELMKKSYNKFIYDRNRQIHKVIRVYKRHRSLKEKYEYNDYGDCISSYHSNSDKEELFTYKYDERGNWIERREDYPQKVSPQAKAGIITSRELSYKTEAGNAYKLNASLKTYVGGLLGKELERIER